MSVKRNLTGNQYGAKVKELFKLIEETDNWEQYVAPQTKEVVMNIYNKGNMTEALEEMGMKYTTARAHLMRALERITSRKLDGLRDGLSRQSIKLLDLMENESWKEPLTEREIELAEKFRETKNFYEAARQLNIPPSTVAITLYGSTQKLGVVNKIKRHLTKKG